MVSSTDFLRAPERPTAIATLNRQRHLTPSCSPLPQREQWAGQGRSLESLTPGRGIKEHYLPTGDISTSKRPRNWTRGPVFIRVRKGSPDDVGRPVREDHYARQLEPNRRHSD